MSIKIVDDLKAKIEHIPLALKPAINGSVNKAKKNYLEITGKNRSPKFFYQEGNTDGYQRTDAQKLALKYFAVSFANPVSGTLMEQEIQSWFSVRTKLQGRLPALWSPIRFFEAHEHAAALLSNICTTYAGGDPLQTRVKAAQLLEKVRELVRHCEAMPEF